MNLLERWQGVYREAARLCDSIERLPEDCRCGDGEAHLAGRCACCSGPAPPMSAVTGGQGCTELLAALRADLLLFYQDLMRVAAPAEQADPAELSHPAKRDILLAAGDIEKMVESLKRVDEWVVGFRQSCAVSEMKGIKRHSAALRTHCDRLDAAIQPVG